MVNSEAEQVGRRRVHDPLAIGIARNDRLVVGNARVDVLADGHRERWGRAVGELLRLSTVGDSDRVVEPDRVANGRWSTWDRR